MPKEPLKNTIAQFAIFRNSTYPKCYYYVVFIILFAGVTQENSADTLGSGFLIEAPKQMLGKFQFGYEPKLALVPIFL